MVCRRLQFCDLCGKLRLGDHAKYFTPPRERAGLRQYLRLKSNQNLRFKMFSLFHECFDVAFSGYYNSRHVFLVHVISCTKLATTSHDTEVPLTLELVTNSNLGTSQRQLLQLVPLTASLSNIS
jgi:hypothetical protein